MSVRLENVHYAINPLSYKIPIQELITEYHTLALSFISELFYCMILTDRQYSLLVLS